MDNETLEDKNWLKRNWRWAFLVLGIVLSLTGFVLSMMPENAFDFGLAFADKALYAKAIERSNENKEVLRLLGKLEPVGKMAIIESNVEYSNDKQSVNLTVRVEGNKGKAKMDVVADKKDKEWHYSLIKIRIKNPEKEITVLQ